MNKRHNEDVPDTNVQETAANKKCRTETGSAIHSPSKLPCIPADVIRHIASFIYSTRVLTTQLETDYSYNWQPIEGTDVRALCREWNQALPLSYLCRERTSVYAQSFQWITSWLKRMQDKLLLRDNDRFVSVRLRNILQEERKAGHSVFVVPRAFARLTSDGAVDNNDNNNRNTTKALISTRNSAWEAFLYSEYGWDDAERKRRLDNFHHDLGRWCENFKHTERAAVHASVYDLIIRDEMETRATLKKVAVSLHHCSTILEVLLTLVYQNDSIDERYKFWWAMTAALVRNYGHAAWVAVSWSLIAHVHYKPKKVDLCVGYNFMNSFHACYEHSYLMCHLLWDQSDHLENEQTYTDAAEKYRVLSAAKNNRPPPSRMFESFRKGISAILQNSK